MAWRHWPPLVALTVQAATTAGADSTFNVFASELFNSITVRKSSSADVDEGSLRATVDLQSGRPFDYKGATAMFSAEERDDDQSGKVDPRAAFLLSNIWGDGKFGALLSAAYSKGRVYEEGLMAILYALRHSQTTNLSGVNGKLRKRFPVAL